MTCSLEVLLKLKKFRLKGLWPSISSESQTRQTNPIYCVNKLRVYYRHYWMPPPQKVYYILRILGHTDHNSSSCRGLACFPHQKYDYNWPQKECCSDLLDF